MCMYIYGDNRESKFGLQRSLAAAFIDHEVLEQGTGTPYAYSCVTLIYRVLIFSSCISEGDMHVVFS